MLAVVPSLVGDYNANGVVDAADYIVWRSTLGSITNLAADGNFNGQIDQADFDIWRAHFGQTAGSSAAAGSNVAIPEPAPSLLLFMVGVLVISSTRRVIVP